MKIEKFEDIVTWQKSRDLTLQIYAIFKSSKDYSFKDQIQRASVSIMNNIAEGFERKSNKELMHFLYIAKGSCGEVRSMLLLGKELKYINSDEYVKLNNLALEISRMLFGFIKTL